MSRQRRLATRYSADLEVSIRGGAWQEPEKFRAKDISRGGLFVRTEAEPELFAEVDLDIVLPWEGRCCVRARIVHVMTADKAAQFGIEPGLGIEFQSMSEEAKAQLDKLLAWASAQSAARGAPRRTAAKQSAELSPMQGYVLSAVDDERGAEDIAARLQLDRDAVDKVLQELVELGLVAQDDSAGEAAGASVEPAVQPKRLRALPTDVKSRAGRRPAPHVTARSMRPALNEDQRRAIDAVHDRLGSDHYAVLDVPREASTEQIRERYLSLSKQFHPDAFTEYSLGLYGKRLTAVFDRLKEAYATLLNPELRASHDGDAAPASKSSSVIDAAPISQRGQPASDGGRPPMSVRRPQIQGSAASEGDGQHVDTVRVRLQQAVKAYESGDVVGASRALDLLGAMEWNRPELRRIFDELERRVATELAGDYEKRARSEEKQQRWKQAARLWLKVCRGRPKDAACHLSAAEALVAMGGQLRKARACAQRAVELTPRDLRARRLLGRIYLEAGLHRNARRELEVAASLARDDAETKALLRQVSEQER